MADCNIILDCCTGQTDCNLDVNIGYLKEFVGSLIKDANGSTVQVSSTKPDTYAPTYSELVSGNIVPLFQDGGTNNWHENVDGIEVTMSTTADGSVKREDLRLIYTRFKSLSVSADKTTFSECGDETNVCTAYKLAKTVRALNDCRVTETTTEGEDTGCRPTFNTTCDWLTVGTCSNNCATLTADKNGTWSAATRTCSVNAIVVYKGETMASEPITITQNELTGSYSVYEGRHYTGVEITGHSETNYDCNGGEFSISAEGYYFDRYKWKDSCDQVYEDNYDDRTGSENAGGDSGTFNKIICPTETYTGKTTLSVSYHGFSDEMDFYQECNQSCGECEDYTTYGTGTSGATVGKCGGLVTVYASVPAVIHHKDFVDGECVETGTTSTAYTQSITVNVPSNETQSATSYTGSKTTAEGGTINYTITQEAGPCGGCTGDVTTYSYGNVTVGPVEACDTDIDVTIPYTATTTYDNCESTTETGETTTSYTISKNETTSPTSYTETFEGIGGATATVTINQKEGPCTCLCSMLTVSPTSLEFSYEAEQRDRTITISSALCTTNIATAGTVTHFNVSQTNNIITVNVKDFNESGADYVETLIISYDADGTTCSSSVTLTQHAQEDPCLGKDCDEFTVTASTTSFDETSHSVNIIRYDASSCVQDMEVTSDENWITVGINDSINAITAEIDAQDCETQARTANVTLTYTVDGNECSSSWTITQSGNTEECPCTDYSYISYQQGANVSISACGGTNFIDISLYRSCQTKPSEPPVQCGFYMTVSRYSPTTYFTYTVNSHRISFSRSTPNTGTTEIVEPFKVDFYEDAAHTNQLHSIIINVKQLPGCVIDPCEGLDCDELTISATQTSFDEGEHEEVEIAELIYDSGIWQCISDSLSVSSDENWLDVSIMGDSIVGTMAARDCGTSERSATVEISWTIDGNTCYEEIEVTQDGDSTPCANPCSCGNFSASTYSLSFYADGRLRTNVSWIKTTECDDTFTLSGDSNVLTEALNTNGTISVTVKENDSITSTYTGIINVMLGSTICTGFNYTVDARECNCNDVNTNTVSTETTSIPKTGDSQFVVYSWPIADAGGCGEFSATSDSCNNLFSNIGTGISGSDYVVSGSVSPNTNENDLYCNIGYEIYSDGSLCSSAQTQVTVAGTGACDCNSSNAALGDFSFGSGNVPYTGGRYYITYTADCGTVSATCDDNWANFVSADTVNKRIYFDVDSTSSSTSRNTYIYLHINGGSYCTYKAFSQDAFVCDCSNANITLSANSESFDYEGSTSEMLYYKSDCGTIMLSADTSWIEVGNVGYGSWNYVQYSVAENYDFSNSRTGHMRIYLSGHKDDCYEIFTITQGERECNCDTADLTVLGKINVPYVAGSSVEVGYITANCISSISFSSATPSQLSNLRLGEISQSGGVYYCTIIGNLTENTDYQNRSLIYRVLYDGSVCGGNVTMTQEGHCTCNNSNFAINDTEFSFASGASGNTISFDSDCGTVSASTNANWITIKYIENYEVAFDVTENQTYSQRSGQIIVYHCNGNNGSCSSGECYSAVTVTQAAGSPPCYCSGLTLTNIPYSASSTCMSSDAHSGIVIAYYEPYCGEFKTLTSSDNWIYSINNYVSGNIGYITANTSANCSAARSATITIGYTDKNGTTCTNKTFTVWQCAGGYSGISSSTQVGCSGGTVTFTPNSR